MNDRLNPSLVEDSLGFDADRLVAQARTAPAIAQQLALDAAELLGQSAERFDSYKDAGFFKRLWNAAAGRNARMARAHVSDLAGMQRCAFAFLNELQGQNLLQARAIAVLRNNVQALAGAATETRRMMLQIVERLDERLVSAEADIALSKWAHRVRARRELPALRPLPRFLSLVFDYLHALQDHAIDYDPAALDQWLLPVLITFDVDGSAAHRVAELAQAMLDEQRAHDGADVARLIALSVDGEDVSGDFIVDNVSGAGYNVFYRVATARARIVDVLVDLGLDPAAHAERIDAAVLARVPFHDTRYSLAELAHEIVAGSLIAADLHRLAQAPQDAPAPEEAPRIAIAASPVAPRSIGAQLEANVSIARHEFLVDEPTPGERQAYVESFGLLFADHGHVPARASHYLGAIGRLFGCAEAASDVVQEARRRGVDAPALQRLLNTPARLFAWIVDATFLGTTSGTLAPDTGDVIHALGKVLGIKRDLLVNVLSLATTISNADDKNAVLAAVGALDHQSHQWRAVLDFRRFSFAGVWCDLEREIAERVLDGFTGLFGRAMKFHDCRMRTMNAGFTFGDENLLQRGVIAFQRADVSSDIDKIRKECEARIELLQPLVSKANATFRLFGQPTMSLPSLFRTELDKDSSLANANWGDNTGRVIDALEEASNALAEIPDKLQQRMAAIAAAYC